MKTIKLKRLFIAILACVAVMAACFSFGCSENESDIDKPPVTNVEEEAALGEWKRLSWTYIDSENQNATLEYLLFVPNAYDGKAEIPLVTWIGDASVVGYEQTKLLQQKAPSVWTGNDKVKQKTYFFLTFLFTSNATSPEKEGTQGAQVVPIIDRVVDDYKVDEKRLYLTGQSMGGICDFMLNTLYPDKFAATFYVACQPGGDGGADDVQAQKVLSEAKFLNQKFVYIASEKDEKAYPGQQSVQAVLDVNGKVYTKLGGLAMNGDAVETAIAAELNKGADFNFFSYTSTSKLDSSSGGQHMATWPLAYQLNAVWSWLFDQSLA